MYTLYSWANGSDYHVFKTGDNISDVLNDAWGVEYHGQFCDLKNAFAHAKRLGLGVL